MFAPSSTARRVGYAVAAVLVVIALLALAGAHPKLPGVK